MEPEGSTVSCALGTHRHKTGTPYALSFFFRNSSDYPCSLQKCWISGKIAQLRACLRCHLLNGFVLTVLLNLYLF